MTKINQFLTVSQTTSSMPSGHLILQFTPVIGIELFYRSESRGKLRVMEITVVHTGEISPPEAQLSPAPFLTYFHTFPATNKCCVCQHTHFSIFNRPYTFQLFEFPIEQVYNTFLISSFIELNKSFKMCSFSVCMSHDFT